MGSKDAKKVPQVAHIVSRAASTAVRRHVKPSPPPKESNLGLQIFVYNHLQTNQVIYSLKKVLKNNHALRQIPYNGKKTVPAALRKDLWAPLACINFTEAGPTDAPSSSPTPSSSRPPLQQYGLKTFQKLREFRRLHETQWPKSFALDPKTNRPLSRVERGRRLCDQKANSVADMAAALEAVTTRVSVREVEVEVRREREGGVAVVEKVLREEKVAEPLAMATVQWTDILDAEFASFWPKTVVHDQWMTTFNNRKPAIARTELRELEGLEPEPEPEPVPEPVKNEAGKVVL